MENNIQLVVDVLEIFDVEDTTWESDRMWSLEDTEIAEMVKGDPDPFFILMDAARTGISKNMKNYTEKSIYNVAELVIGKQMYLGHQRPEDRAYEYRIPQGRVVESRVDKIIDNDGQEVYVTKAKAYVSREAKTLRTNIREKMAGPVSIDGVAVLEMNGDENIPDVVEITKLRSVDFCNPGTEGIKEAGVKAIVSEMDSSDGEEQMKKLTKSELLSQYEGEIREIASEKVDEVKKEYDTEIQEMKKELSVKDLKIKELEKQVETTVQEMDQLKNDHVTVQNKLNTSKLEDFKREYIVKLDTTDEIREMLAEKIEVVLGEDFDTSKETLQKNIDGKLSEIREIMDKVKTQKTSAGNPPKKIDSAIEAKAEMRKAIFFSQE